jgi:ATP-dependent Clp protease ATP-binding subunit ClpC
VPERLGEGGKQAVARAQEEARGLGHGFVGTEHLLLGLIADDGAAGRFLGSLGVTLQAARAEVARIIGPEAEVPGGELPLTPRSKRVLELGGREAAALGHTVAGAEHLLLGLLREGEGVANVVLAKRFGVSSAEARLRLVEALPGNHP